MKVENEKPVEITINLIEDLVKAITGNWNPGKSKEKDKK